VRWVDNQRSRWGSCTPADRTIRLSRRLQDMPAWVIDYVLVHELVHLHVGRAREAHAWHGRTFKATLAQAMDEAYGVRGVPTRSTLHGAYAEAIERLRAQPQLEMDLA